MGRDHLVREANAQDAFAVRTGVSTSGAAYVAAVVTDGCGSAPRSEIGAALLARLVADEAERGLSRGLSAAELPGRALSHARERLTEMVKLFAGTNAERTAFVHDCLLSTVLVLLDDGKTLALAAQGDGVLVIDDEVMVLDHEDAPPYLGYSVLGEAVPPPTIVIRDAAAVSRAAIATDGIPPELAPLLFGHRGRSLARFLNVEARRRPLRDDATVVVLERDGRSDA
jgi:hypothetical protein